MQWIKALLIGLLGSLVMFIIMILGINVTGIAPFNIPPSAAFLVSLDLYIGPLPLLVHFGYGAFWSIVLVAIYGSVVDTVKGIKLAGILWLIMMVIYSPIIGWGFFGFGGSAQQLAADSKLYLESGPKYLVITLILHLIYGSIIGWFNKIWTAKSS